jgi:hypothetical protein
MSPVSQPKRSSSELFHDQPVRSAKDDLFGWGDLAKRLGDALTLTSEDPIVIGLYGAWGSGKSSLMNMVAESLEARPPKESFASGVVVRKAADLEIQRILGADTGGLPSPVSPAVPSCILVRFNPWYFKGEEALIQAFFQEMSTAIGGSTIPFKQRIVEAIKKYSAWLVPLGSVATILAMPVFGGPAAAMAATAFAAGAKPTHELSGGITEAMGKQESSLSEQRDLLIAALRESKVRIVVLIDDIDRLYADDVLTMMKLVRLVGDLPYVSYLLGFDQEVVAGCLSKAGPQTNGHESGKDYLAKIVQLCVQVPTPRADQLCEYAINELSTLVQTLHEGSAAESIIDQIDDEWRRVFGYRLADLRQVKRILQAARVALFLTKERASPVDVILMETCRIYSPGFFSWMFNHRDLILSQMNTVALTTTTEQDKQIHDALTQQCKTGQIERGAMEDLVSLVRLKRALTAQGNGVDRFQNAAGLGRAMNLGTDPSPVISWSVFQAPVNKFTASPVELQVRRFINDLLREGGSWLSVLGRIRNNAGTYDPTIAEAMLRELLSNSTAVVVDGGDSGRGERALARTCVALLQNLPTLAPESWVSGSPSIGFLSVLGEQINQENHRQYQISTVRDVGRASISPLDTTARRFADAVRQLTIDLGRLHDWLDERPSHRVRQALSAFSWPNRDKAKHQQLLNVLAQSSREGRSGFQRVLHIFFTNLENGSTTSPSNSYQLLKEFIDPHQLILRLEPAPIHQHLNKVDLLELLASEETPERALKLFATPTQHG